MNTFYEKECQFYGCTVFVVIMINKWQNTALFVST